MTRNSVKQRRVEIRKSVSNSEENYYNSENTFDKKDDDIFEIEKIVGKKVSRWGTI